MLSSVYTKVLNGATVFHLNTLQTHKPQTCMWWWCSLNIRFCWEKVGFVCSRMSRSSKMWDKHYIPLYTILCPGILINLPPCRCLGYSACTCVLFSKFAAYSALIIKSSACFSANCRPGPEKKCESSTSKGNSFTWIRFPLIHTFHIGTNCVVNFPFLP